MKKYVIIVFFVCVLVVSICCLFGCKNPVTEEIHRCSFDKVVDNRYLKKQATCESPAEYYFSCECGRVADETFYYGSVKEHRFTMKVVQDSYLCREATCQSPALYYKSCSCGERGTETFSYGGCADHKFNQKVTTSQYLYSEADCYNSAYYYWSCVCGAIDSTTFSYGTVKHNYKMEVASSKFLCSEATCQNSATYYKSCVCGKRGTETFEYGTTLQHEMYTVSVETNWHTMKCKLCGGAYEYAPHDFDANYICRCGYEYDFTKYFTFTVDKGEATLTGFQRAYSVNYPKNLKIPSSYNGFPVTKIGEGAFSGRSMLVNVIIPEGVVTIGCGAFTGCSSMKTIIIPSSVKSVDYTPPNTASSKAFQECYCLEEVHFQGSLEDWLSISFHQGMGSNPLWTGAELYINDSIVKDVVIPDSITEIKPNAFSGYKNLESVTIPNSVIKIDEGAFRSCSNLTNITIPDSVTSIGESAFERCSNLVSVKLSANLSQISAYTFCKCRSLLSIVIPAKVRAIGSCAFSDCESLGSAIFENTNNWQIRHNGWTGNQWIVFNVSNPVSAAADLKSDGLPECKRTY